ncbi:hypothetical protein EDD21DRAFT_440324 [Dissophora ornata]|nr:hypothetical protein EDD21DRAFT_440324 [Dissophora ornata]
MNSMLHHWEQQQQQQQQHHHSHVQCVHKLIVPIISKSTRTTGTSADLLSPPDLLSRTTENTAEDPADTLGHHQSARTAGHLQQSSLKEPSAGGVPTAYEELLIQLATQRAKLNALNDGAQTLSRDIAALNETLEEEQESKGEIVQDAQTAMEGWTDMWKEYSRCEPAEALQERPNALTALIGGMGWQYKKDLFEQLVASCRPREAYQMQLQITGRFGQVMGFDLLEESPLPISKMIMKYLSFIDLATCRMVSRSWQRKATAYDVVASAVSRLTLVDETVLVEQADGSRPNWNQLCRYHERSFRWMRGTPASVQSLQGHTSYVTSLKDRGGWIVSGGYDEKVRLWEATTGKCVKIWEVDSAVSCVELFVDADMDGGGVVVAAFVDIGLVKVWSLHGPLNMKTLTGHQKGVRALAINAAYLATAGFDQTVHVWNWSAGWVHLSENTVYSFCIDATLRVFDVPSKTLLHQVKLFEVQQGASMQWSYVQDKMLLTATNRKIYVWQLEHLESLVQQQHQQRQRQYHQRQRQQQQASQRSNSIISTPSSDGSNSPEKCRGGEHLKFERGYTPLSSPLHSPAQSRSMSPCKSAIITPPETPIVSVHPSSGSSCFYSSSSASTSSLTLTTDTPSKVEPSEPTIETRIKPCLTAILSMTTDMRCGKVTHHNPPQLIVGSRSSPVKLATIVLTKDIIDPNKVYDSNNTPTLLSPKNVPIEGMPGGHGRGVMCIDCDAGNLVVGCTGGSIQVLHMDPAKRVLEQWNTFEAVPVITLPQLSLAQMDSIRSVSPIHHPSNPISPITTPAALANLNTVSAGHPKKSAADFRSNKSQSIVARPKALGLPSPDHSPQKMSKTIKLTTSANRGIRGTNPQGTISELVKQPMTSSNCQKQDVLADCGDFDKVDVLRQGSPNILTRAGQSHKSAKPSRLTGSISPKTSPPSLLPRANGRSVAELNKVSASVPNVRRTTTAPTLSSLSKYIPGPPGRITLRRRASSAAWADQVTSTTTTIVTNVDDANNSDLPSPMAVIMRGRNRSDPNLLTRANIGSPYSTAKNFAKSWSLSSPWSNSSRRNTNSSNA